MGDLQQRIQRAKEEWTLRLEDFGIHHATEGHERNGSHGGSLLPQPALTPFRVLLSLFAYKDVLDNGQLDSVFEEDATALTHLCPQLLGFLLHGAYTSSPALEEWILSKCSKNLYFAHQCYWFLRAWCLEVPTPKVVGTPLSLSRSNSSSALATNVPSGPFLDQPASPEQRLECWNPVASSKQGEARLSNTADKLLPGERILITALMERVRECGQIPAKELEYGGSACSVVPPSPSQKRLAVEKGWIPINPSSNLPSARHLANLNAEQKLVASVESNQVDAAPQFLDALLHLAESLFSVNRDDRKAELRRALTTIECEWLPCNCLYLPLGNAHHKVWRIAIEESFPIHTKERVPCIICFEVLDDPKPPKSPRSNWLFRQTALGDTGLSPPSTRERATSMDLAAVELSEAEMISAWRFGSRNPYRCSTVLDRVTQAYKGPLEKVKTTMDALRDRGLSEELQSLTLSRPLYDNGVAAAKSEDKGNSSDFTETTVPFGAEIEDDQVSPGSNRPAVSRTSSAGSLVSMGQWGSPLVVNTKPDDLDDLGNSLRYGSDHEEEGATDTLVEQEVKKEAKPVEKKKPAVVFRESWQTKQERVRSRSAMGCRKGWRLLPVLLKANDDLRQEQLASQLIYRMAAILARESVPVWLCPYEIIALTDSAGIIEAIPDTISLDSLKRNGPNFSGLRKFFETHFVDPKEFANARASFVESLAAYSVVCFLLQLKDRHNGNILLDNQGHVIHIDFGFFFLSSPGKNAGFESAPFKLTSDFCEVMDGPDSRLFSLFRELCVKTFLTLRRHCMEIILLVEMLKNGNEELPCFCGRPDDAIAGLRERFRLDLNDRACKEYVQSLVDDSIENWRTDWYDKYQRYFVGVL